MLEQPIPADRGLDGGRRSGNAAADVPGFPMLDCFGAGSPFVSNGPSTIIHFSRSDEAQVALGAGCTIRAARTDFSRRDLSCGT